MIIEKARLFRFSVPLKESVSLPSGSLDHREGFLIRLKGENGAWGWGEASPLPGYSTDSIEETGRDLKDLCAALPRDVEEIWPMLDNMAAPVSFAVESAIADLEKEQLPRATRINGLVLSSPSKWKADCKRLLKAGFGTVKLKIGKDVAAEIKGVKGVHETVNGALRFRLDANRRLEFEEGLVLNHELAGLPIDYLEEPFEDPKAVAILGAEGGLPIALDESLAKCGRKFPENISALVVKPALLGAGSRLEKILNAARKREIPFTFSSCFETGVGLLGILRLVERWGGAGRVHGLDTTGFLVDSLVGDRIAVQDGKMFFDTSGPLAVNDKYLESYP